MDRFHLINVFVAVVDTNGFAGAARKLNMSPPAVTRAVNELETHLGLRLLTRTTRTVRVTDAGGFGLTQLLSYQVAEHLRTGKLKTVLPDFEPAALPVHVVHRQGRQAPQRVRAFLDLVIERLKQDAALN